jgi:hypothetical protein
VVVARRHVEETIAGAEANAAAVVRAGAAERMLRGLGLVADVGDDVDAIRNAISAPNVKFTVNPPYLVFDPIAELRPNEPLSVLVVVTATAAGDANFTVEYKSDSMPAAQSRTQVINVAPR